MRLAIAPTVIATALVLAAGTTAFSSLTGGFASVTSEGSRRASVIKAAIQVPSMSGADQDGRRRSLFEDALHPGSPGRVAIVNFIYTRCISICRASGTREEQLQAEIRSRHVEGRVRLVTITFDPVHDTVDAIRAYASRLHADPFIWTFFRPENAAELSAVMVASGIVVIPAPMGEFQHNAAFLVFNRRNQLVRVIDADDPSAALDAALEVGA